MTYPDYWILMHRIADQLTPMALRKGVWRALTQALLSPVATLAADGRSFIVDKRRRMEHNGQVRLLERICNILMLGEYDISDPLPSMSSLSHPTGGGSPKAASTTTPTARTRGTSPTTTPSKPPSNTPYCTTAAATWRASAS